MEEHKIRSIKEASLDVQIIWTMGELAEFLEITKKNLRKAIKIMREPILEEQIFAEGVSIKRTFSFGFECYFSKKKNKKPRLIHAPHPDIQIVLSAMRKKITSLYSPSGNAFGFVKGKNIKKAVNRLLKGKHFIAFDIAEAFPSISFDDVEKALGCLEIPKELISPLAFIATYEFNGKRRLPQGSSCSPALLNLVYKPMCEEISRICKENGIKWFVYADDFCFAAEKIPSEVKERIFSIPAKYGFSIKPEKNRDNLEKTIPQMLGLTIVDGKIHLKRKTKKKFRSILYMAKYEKYSPSQIAGVISVIRQIYGPKKNWPGWLIKTGKK